MDTLQYFMDRYKIGELETPAQGFPYMIPNIGRNVIPGWLHHLDMKKGVEIGVASGEFSQRLISANPQMHLTGIDPYSPYQGYTDYTLKETLIRMEKEAIKAMSKYHNYTFLKKTSMEALNDFEDESLDFIYIDGNHDNPYITQDLNSWPSKIRSGGIITGHDYMRSRQKTFKVIQTTRKYARDNNIKLWFVLGAEGKKRGTTRDSSRSWMFIKP